MRIVGNPMPTPTPMAIWSEVASLPEPDDVPVLLSEVLPAGRDEVVVLDPKFVRVGDVPVVSEVSSEKSPVRVMERGSM